MARLSCHRKFVAKIPLVLAKGPLKTKEIYNEIKELVPACISDEICSHGGNGSNRTDYEWQHSVRRAQYSLKKKNIISNFGDRWYVLPTNNLRDEIEEMEIEKIYRNESIEKIRTELKSLSPKSAKFETIQGIRFTRDMATVAKIKILREFRCQICNTRIVKADGSYYAEGAHISPKRSGSPETPDNIIILCPNHHKEFDLGKREMLEHNSEFVHFILNGEEHRISLSV
ncbi:MAG: HNH endonuclease [Thermoplasmatales archaeon]